MSQRVRRGLLTLLFGLAQVLGVVLLVIGWYYLGHIETALEIIDNPENVSTIGYIAAGFLLFFFAVVVSLLIGGCGFLIYQWGKFTQKKATKWNRKINNKLYDRREKKRLRARTAQTNTTSQAPDWEV